VSAAVATLEYTHVDVFTPVPYAGNSLPVFRDARGLTAAQMLRITQELRHFEAIFLEPTARPGAVRARVFDLREELPFAGHPVIGAAAVLHHAAGDHTARHWEVALPGKTVRVATERTSRGYTGVVDQGRPTLHGEIADRARFARAFGLDAEDLDPALPLEIVSTGLRYLIVPVRSGALARARIAHDITALLHGSGAEFAVLFDEVALEIRHWNNDGVLEDVATGSAAGTIGAYRLRHRLARGGERFVLHQGRFTGRPSRLFVQADGLPEALQAVSVGGDVAVVGRAMLEATP